MRPVSTQSVSDIMHTRGHGTQNALDVDMDP